LSILYGSQKAKCQNTTLLTFCYFCKKYHFTFTAFTLRWFASTYIRYIIEALLNTYRSFLESKNYSFLRHVLNNTAIKWNVTLISLTHKQFEQKIEKMRIPNVSPTQQNWKCCQSLIWWNLPLNWNTRKSIFCLLTYLRNCIILRILKNIISDHDAYKFTFSSQKMVIYIIIISFSWFWILVKSNLMKLTCILVVVISLEWTR
jgi:hypothetical protein